MGKSVLPHSEIPSLVDNDGNFCDDYINFTKRYLTGRIAINEIRLELSAQIQKIINSRLKISHVDSHQHIHVLPGILEIIMEIADKANIHAIRIPAVKGINFSAGKMGLKLLSLFARRRAIKKGFVFPDYFAGIVAGTSINEKWLCEIIDNLQEGVTEIMTHPGIDNKILQPYFKLAHNFEQELKRFDLEYYNI